MSRSLALRPFIERAGVRLPTPMLSVLVLLSCIGALTAGPESLSDQQIREITTSVSEIRGLAVMEEIPVKEMSRERLSDYIRRELKMELTPVKARKYERSLQAFGLFPRDRSLMSMLEDLLVRSIAGFYEPETDELYLIKESGGGTGTHVFNPFRDALETLDIDSRELYASHELTHALQDQHFDLRTLPLRDDENDDRVLAQKALIEGEATYVMYEYLLNKQGMSFDMVRSSVQPALEELMFSDQPAYPRADVPLYLQKTLIFPYMAGLWFVVDGIKPGTTEKWQALNRAYRDMPSSTEQILHPDAYFGDRDVPEWPTLPEFPGLTGENYSFQQENRFGEYGIHLLFLEQFHGKRTKIRKAREGWDGDVYRTYANGAGNRFRYLWMTTWDSPEDAKEFASLYGTVLKQKQKDPKTLTRSGRQLILSTDGRLSFVHRIGEHVLTGEGLALDDAQSVMSRAWQKTTWSSP